MKVPTYFQTMPHAINIIVVGCGGTGSLLLQHLARINKTLISQGKKGLMVTCIDDDIVNEHNLGRQLFTESDLGRYKAAVCIERINRFYGTSWDVICEKFDAGTTRHDCVPGNILISCTDDSVSRKMIDVVLKNAVHKNYSESYYNYFWIDTGNSRYTGQVIMGSEQLKIPSVIDLFPDISSFEKKQKNVPSCSLAEAIKHQDLMINPKVAAETAQLVWNITQQKMLLWTQCYINLKKMIPVRYKHHETSTVKISNT